MLPTCAAAALLHPDGVRRRVGADEDAVARARCLYQVEAVLLGPCKGGGGKPLASRRQPKGSAEAVARV